MSSGELNIPESWAETALGDIIDVRDGTHDSPKLTNSGIIFITSKNLKDGQLLLNDCSYISKEDHDQIKQRSEVSKGDLLMAMIGTIGNPVVVETDEEFSIKNIALFKKNNLLSDLRFLKFFIDAPLFEDLTEAKKRGANQQFLSLKVLRGLSYPLPPLKEQTRIVEKIESCFSKIEKTEAALNEAEKLLVKYRESLLAKAFRGELVEQDPNDEPASELLKRFKKEQEKKRKKDDAPSFKDDMPFNIPDSWEGLSFIELVYLRARIGWKGLKASEYSEKGPRFISVREFNPDGTIDFNSTAHITQERYDESPEIMLKNDDVLLCKDGSTIGKVTIVKGLKEQATVNSSIAVMTPFKGVDANYLFYYLKAPIFQSLVQSRIQGAAIPHIFQKDLRALFIPLPPEKEQKRIVAELDRCFEKINSLIEIINQAKKTNSKLKESILNNAFQGKLVPQIPEEGTGHDLLEQILKEKATAAGAAKATKEKSAKKTTAKRKK